MFLQELDDLKTNMSTNSFHDYVDLKSRTNTRQFSDDEEFTTPPKLSNFGSALLSHTEKTSASEILSSHNNDKIANRLEEMDRSSSRSHPPPSMGNLTSGHASLVIISQISSEQG